VPSRCFVVLPDGTERLLVVQPDGVVLPVNTLHCDPTVRHVFADRPGDHALALLSALDTDPVALYSSVHSAHEWLLRTGFVEALGTGPGEPVCWRRARVLFACPNPAIGDFFPEKSRCVRFEVPRQDLYDAVRLGRLHVNLFLAEQGGPLDPDARFGEPDVGVDVVAEGDSVEWLIRHLAP